MAESLRSKLYYMQDKRQFVGNDVLWWAIGSNGYTTNIDKAELFTEQEIKSYRDTDIPWPFDYINSIARRAVDMQYLDKEKSPAYMKNNLKED